MACALPIEAAFSKHSKERAGSFPEYRKPMLHIAPGSPASTAMERSLSASARSDFTPSPTMYMYPNEEAALTLPDSIAFL